MAALTNIASSPRGISFGPQQIRRLAYTTLPKRTSCPFQQKKNRELEYGIHIKKPTNTRFSNDFMLSCLMDDSISSLSSSSSPPSDMVINFYRCINEKNLEELSNHISDDCLIEDSLFIKPFKGKKEAMRFFEELTQSMGQHVKFRIGNVYQGGTSGAGAIWHLVWKEIDIPFTKGCTFIDITKGEKNTIQKAQIILEPQVKTGHLILTLLKFVTLLLTKFAAIPEWFQKASQLRGIKWISKICLTLFKCFLDNFLKSYLTFARLVAQVANYAFKILQYISKFFFK